MRVEEERPTRADPSPPDPFLGQVVGGCRIDEVLGRGGMGVVYKATQLSLNRPVAIKVLAEDVCGQQQFVERFKREVDILSRLSHPNVVTVLERGEVEGRLYVIMEYVHGTSLREVMRKGPLPAAEALVIVRGVLSALEHAHEKGIIHRDIKPENVLVAPGGIVKVADFGLSRLVGPVDATRLTHTQLLLGTFEYMAPEQRERAKEADERADIYATGVVLYEMLAGELPIGHFAALSRKRPRECDSRIDEIVEKSLAKAPADRYQRASEMGAAVSRVLSAATAPPPEPPPAEVPPEVEKRGREKRRPEVHVASRLTAEEEARAAKSWCWPRRSEGTHDRPRRRKHEDPASGLGCLVFLLLLLTHRGLIVSILGAVIAVAVVRALAGAGNVLRGIVGLLAAAAVVGAIFLFTSVRSSLEDGTAVELSNASGATLNLGSSTAPLADLAGFLDDERAAWIRSLVAMPFPVDAATVDLEVVEGEVVARIHAEQSATLAQLRQLGAALSLALAAAYPDAFEPGPGFPDLDTTAAGPPPGPQGEWTLEVAIYRGVSDEEAEQVAAQVLSDSRVKEYLIEWSGAPQSFPKGVRLRASGGTILATFERRTYAAKWVAERVTAGLAAWVCKRGGKEFRPANPLVVPEILDDR